MVTPGGAIWCSAVQHRKGEALPWPELAAATGLGPAPALYSVLSAQSSVDNSTVVITRRRRRYGRGRRQAGGHSRQDRQVWRPGTAAGTGDLVQVLVGGMINYANVARTFSVR